MFDIFAAFVYRNGVSSANSAFQMHARGSVSKLSYKSFVLWTPHVSQVCMSVGNVYQKLTSSSYGLPACIDNSKPCTEMLFVFGASKTLSIHIECARNCFASLVVSATSFLCIAF